MIRAQGDCQPPFPIYCISLFLLRLSTAHLVIMTIEKDLGHSANNCIRERVFGLAQSYDLIVVSRRGLLVHRTSLT